MIETISTLVADLFPDSFSTEHFLHFFSGLDLAAVGLISCKKWRPASGKLYDGADGYDQLIMLLNILI